MAGRLMEHGGWVTKDNRGNEDETGVELEQLKVMVPLAKWRMEEEKQI